MPGSQHEKLAFTRDVDLGSWRHQDEVSKLRIGLLPIMLKNAKKKELMTIGNKSCFTFIKKLVKKSCLCDKNSWSIILVNCQEALIKTLLPLLVFCNKQPCLLLWTEVCRFPFFIKVQYLLCHYSSGHHNHNWIPERMAHCVIQGPLFQEDFLGPWTLPLVFYHWGGS